jgi:hypothetical protein
MSRILIPKDLRRGLDNPDRLRTRNRRQECDKTVQRAAPAIKERQKPMFFDQNGQFLDGAVYVLGYLLLFYEMGWGEPDIFRIFIFAAV